MTLPVYRLRRWLAATAVVLTLAVAGMYFYARLKQRAVGRFIPGKIGIDIKRTASGFQFSKSDGKRTLFTIQASDIKEFKINGHAELHNVSIVLYGRDSSRFDQIYGDDFAYDPKSGDVTAKGDVQIDLEANPAGGDSADQATPKAVKNPIHLKTRDLVFNRESGNASTDARVEFRTPQASGWAVGVHYLGKSNTLTLTSQVHVEMTGAESGVIEAAHGTITNEPRQIVLDQPRLAREGSTMQADRATFFLNDDNNLDRVLATGHVETATQKMPERLGKKSKSAAQSGPLHAFADEAELLLEGNPDRVRKASLSGNVRIEQGGPQPMHGTAGRVILDYAGANRLQKVRAEDGVRLTQKAASSDKPKANSAAPQDFELTAPAIDFFLADGRALDRAVTSGAAQIAISPAEGAPTNAKAERTVVTAGNFEAKFVKNDEGSSRMASLHGEPDARIVNMSAGHPDRVSTSQSVDASFLPQGGIESVTQQGSVVFTDGQDAAKQMQAWSDRARYTPTDQVVVMTGSPRIAAGGMATTANSIRINRATGEASADGDVRSTYSQLTEQPNGALLASSSPIHVTARTMTAHGAPNSQAANLSTGQKMPPQNALAVALYSGDARLWQDANVIEAPTIQFDRDHRSVVAQGTAAQPVSTILIQPEKKLPESAAGDAKTLLQPVGKPRKSASSSPIAITGTRLTYADSERKAHYDGGVIAKSADFTATANSVDIYLVPHSQTATSQSVSGISTGPGQLDRMVAQGDVLIQQPKRKAQSQTMVYTAADDKFVLTGGPPSIFDAERGKITGVSLTFYKRDDRVLVEGEASTPVVTQTRVAR